MSTEERIPPIVYWISKAIVLTGLKLVTRWKVVGKENVPKSGPLVFGSNHISNFDPIVIGASTNRQVRFMAKHELFKSPLIGRFLRYYGAFSVKRGMQDTTAMRQAIAIPHHGGCVVVFPEGSRSRTGEVGKGMPGVALIARKANAPIIPVAIVGPYRWFGPLTVRFGQPLIPSPDDTNESLLEKLMTSIRELKNAGHSA